MAYIQNNPNADPNTQLQQLQNAPAPISLTQDSGQVARGSNAATMAPIRSQNPAGGSTFQDPSKYLSMNQAGAERLGSQLGGQVTNQANMAQNDLMAAKNQFGQAQMPYEQALNQGYVNQAAKDPLSLFNYHSMTNANTNPLPVPAQGPQQMKGKGGNFQNKPNFEPQNRNRFMPPTPISPPTSPLGIANPAAYNYLTGLRTGTYQGPQDLTGNTAYQQAQNEANQANQMTQNLQDPAARAAALRALSGEAQNYGRGGASNLDQALLQSGKGQQRLNQSLEGAKGLTDQLGAANQEAQARSQAAQQNYAGNQAALGQAFQGLYPKFQQDMADKLKAAQNQYAQQKGRGKQISRNLTGASVANPNDYARLQALNQLMGTNYSI